mmetsp:Transcript_60772/g.188433  ORF Transcript_60772/g.188433 Transcript_60772/m.188433 type:complete len:202 (+) Transcript_60772:347-952(+)
MASSRRAGLAHRGLRSQRQTAPTACGRPRCCCMGKELAQALPAAARDRAELASHALAQGIPKGLRHRRVLPHVLQQGCGLLAQSRVLRRDGEVLLARRPAARPGPRAQPQRSAGVTQQRQEAPGGAPRRRARPGAAGRRGAGAPPGRSGHRLSCWQQHERHTDQNMRRQTTQKARPRDEADLVQRVAECQVLLAQPSLLLT